MPSLAYYYLCQKAGVLRLTKNTMTSSEIYLKLSPPLPGITIVSCVKIDEVLDCKLAIYGVEKKVKFMREKFRGEHFWSSELVYIQIPTPLNSFLNGDRLQDPSYSNMVRRSSLAIQQESEIFYLLTTFEVRNTVAIVVSWTDSEKGKRLASFEAFDSFPVPILAES